jgi:hypothetical protein
MNNNLDRIGNFTSSEIAALMTVNIKKDGFGKPAITYIEETNFERKLGRSLTDDSSARPLTWGQLLEKRAFDILGLEYVLSSTETDLHPNIPFWAGSKDGIKYDEGQTIIDIKCPITLKSFCQFADCNTIEEVRQNHKDGEKYYWQLVSNAVITGSRFAELIVYVPFYSELPEIRQMAQRVPDSELNKHYWIAMANDGELPFINDNGYYNHLHIIRFEVPQADKDLLTANVLKAGEMLIDYKNIKKEKIKNVAEVQPMKVNISLN